MTQKVKSKYWQQTHTFGIKITKYIPESLEINKHNGNHLWRDSINKEMPNIENAVDEYDGDPSNLIGYQKIMGHMIFNIKIGKNFCRRARFVAGGHKTENPRSINYSTVVSRDYVRFFCDHCSP